MGFDVGVSQEGERGEQFPDGNWEAHTDGD
jgi:hypothetical protein